MKNIVLKISISIVLSGLIIQAQMAEKPNDQLINETQSQDTQTKQTAAYELAVRITNLKSLDSNEKASFESAFRNLLDDPDANVRKHSLAGLSQIYLKEKDNSGQSNLPIDELIAGINDTDPGVQKTSLEFLCFAESNQELTNTLQELSDIDNPRIREFVVRYMGGLNPITPSAKSILETAVNDDNIEVQRTALMLLVSCLDNYETPSGSLSFAATI